MLILSPHSASTSLTLLSYDREVGHVIVKTTHPTDVDPESTSIPLAQFLHEIGIPFRAARDAARSAPESEPAIA